MGYRSNALDYWEEYRKGEPIPDDLENYESSSDTYSYSDSSDSESSYSGSSNS